MAGISTAGPRAAYGYGFPNEYVAFNSREEQTQQAERPQRNRVGTQSNTTDAGECNKECMDRWQNWCFWKYYTGNRREELGMVK